MPSPMEPTALTGDCNPYKILVSIAKNKTDRQHSNQLLAHPTELTRSLLYCRL